MTRLAVQAITKRYGGITALDGATFSIDAPGIYGLIGPNGAGKTTLFDVISGNVRPDSGEVLLEGRRVTGSAPHRMANWGVARTFQECRILPEASCLDNLLFAAQAKGFGTTLGQLVTRSTARRRARVDEAMRLLALTNLQDYAHTVASSLSFGQRRLLEIVSREADPSAVLEALPTSHSTPELNVPCAEGEPRRVIEQLAERIAAGALTFGRRS